MALTTSLITGRVPMPDDSAATTCELTFTLSGLDTQGADVIPPSARVRSVMLVDGAIPAGFRLWRNTTGTRGTHYIVTARWVSPDRKRGVEDFERVLGHIQVGSAASYTLANLLNSAVTPATPSFWMAISQGQYDDFETMRDETEAARDEAVVFAAASAAARISAEAAAAIADATSGAGIADLAVFISQNAAGTFDGLDNGQVIVAGGNRYVRAAGSTLLPTLPGWEPAPTPTLSAYLGDIRAMTKRGGGIVDQNVSVPGVLETGPNMRLVLNPGQVIKQTLRSRTGAFVTNVVMSSDADRIQSNLFIEGGIISAEDYPDPEEYPVVTIGATTIRLPPEASSVDGFYVGMMVQLMSGGTAGNWWSRYVSSYNGTTKVLVMSVALTGAMIPAAGSVVRLGFNDNGAGGAWGAENVRLTDIVIRGYEMNKMTPVVLGAKAVNFEQGAKNAVMRGLTLEDCGTGIYLNAHPGNHRNDGYPKWVQAIRGSDIHFENCSSAISVGILDGVAGIPDDPALLQAVLSEMTYHNCGHAPWRITGSDQQKSGILNLMGSVGLNVANVRGYNDADYVTKAGGYPTDYPARCGYGLSGPIGAVIWGHARATTISDWHHHGDADKAVHIGRVRALGDDAPPNGVVSQLSGWNINGLYVYGAVNQIVGRDTVTGFNAVELTGHWKIAVNSASFLLDPGLSTGTGWTLELTEIPTGKTVIGTAAQIIARGNTFAEYPPGTTDLRTQDRRIFVMAADTAVSFTPISSYGNINLHAAAALLQNVWRYRVGTSPQCDLYLPTSNSAATTGALTGTTGAAGNFTVSAHTDGRIYLENRRAGPITVNIIIPT